MERQPGIEELVAFLDKNAPALILKIREKHLEYEEILKPGGVLGPSVDLEELKVRAGVCLEAIDVAVQLSESKIIEIKSNMKGTQKIQLYGQLVTTISGTGVLATLAKKDLTISYLCGGLSLLGALVPLIIDYRRKTIDQTRPLFDQYNMFVTLKVEVEKNKRELKFFLNNNFNVDRVAEIISNTNEICDKITKGNYFAV